MSQRHSAFTDCTGLQSTGSVHVGGAGDVVVGAVVVVVATVVV
jgi:hypothetical protein